MAFVGCVINTRPLKSVLFTRYGTAAQWSRWKCVMSATSTPRKSTSSKNGSDIIPLYPGWIPQSSITLFERNVATIHERPTSFPAPRGTTSSTSSDDDIYTLETVCQYPPTLSLSLSHSLFLCVCVCDLSLSLSVAVVLPPRGVVYILTRSMYVCVKLMEWMKHRGEWQAGMMICVSRQ